VMMGRYGHMNFMRIARAKDKQAVSDALERVGMTDYRKRQIGELSGGQKNKDYVMKVTLCWSPHTTSAVFLSFVTEQF